MQIEFDGRRCGGPQTGRSRQPGFVQGQIEPGDVKVVLRSGKLKKQPGGAKSVGAELGRNGYAGKGEDLPGVERVDAE